VEQHGNLGSFVSDELYLYTPFQRRQCQLRSLVYRKFGFKASPF
jgi:hypothetical protein